MTESMHAPATTGEYSLSPIVAGAWRLADWGWTPQQRLAWIEGNRRKVDELSGGKIAYVYMPDTGAGGYQYFNRMFFPQIDKQALIVDDRRNGGGQAANYVTELLSRPYLSSWKDRDGMVFDTPGGAIYGPKAMLIDQDAGSGGDFMPYAFKRVGLGPLIGKRTWGGLIGISANPPLIDGGNQSGMLAMHHATDVAIAKACAHGFALVGVTNSWMSGRSAYYVERIARADLIGLHTVGSASLVAPPGVMDHPGSARCHRRRRSLLATKPTAQCCTKLCHRARQQR